MTEYRKDHHTKREKIIAKYLAQNVKGSYVLMDPKSPVNALITDGSHGIRRFLDIKTRYVPFERYSTSILGEGKYKRLKHLSKLMNSPVTLVVAYTDRLALVNIDELSNIPIAEGGRFDRPDDKQARESCLHIPVEMFMQMPLPEEYPNAA